MVSTPLAPNPHLCYTIPRLAACPVPPALTGSTSRQHRRKRRTAENAYPTVGRQNHVSGARKSHHTFTAIRSNSASGTNNPNVLYPSFCAAASRYIRRHRPSAARTRFIGTQ